MLLHTATVLFFLVLVGPNSFLIAQHRLWRSAQRSALTKFDWNCAEPSWHPQARLNELVQAALRREHDGPQRFADRTFSFDLNGDRSDEIFVPLTCGATGNCGWALLTTNPSRLLGIIRGQNLYVHRLRGQWPVIITYGHLSAVEGSLTTYRFLKNRYLPLGKTYEINHGEYDLDIQGGRGHKMPAFLERAKAACTALGSREQNYRSLDRNAGFGT
jgi:hypothetical protein